MFRASFILTALLSLLTIAGCTRMPGGIAPSTIPLTPGGYTSIREVEGSDCKVNLLGLIPVSGSNYIADAMDEALEEVPGAAALVDVTGERVSKFFILWSQTCTEVRGTAVTIP